jgi:hypothetical protein
MQLVNSNIFGENHFGGYQVELLTGDFAVDGDNTVRLVNFADAAVGSTYWYKVTDNHVQRVVKVGDENRDDDWVVAEGIISQRLVYADFTAVTTTGTVALNGTIPVGAYTEKCNVRNLTGFSGDVTATITVSGGVDGTDVDGYMTGTPSVFTTAAVVVMGVPSAASAARTVTTAFAPTVVITKSTTSFATGTAGALTVTCFYKV